METDVTFTIKQSQINRYIAEVLDEKHPGYPYFTQGIKEFISWVSNP